MPRFNKIYAGPVSENMPQIQELPADVAILPGSIITASAGEYILGTATTTGRVLIAQDNYLALEDVDTAYAIGDRVLGMELLDGRLYNARVATGNSLVVGSPLTPGAAGVLVLASTSDMVVAFSDETYNNNTGSVQLVRVRAAKGYLTAA